jgi:hypothetical protein
MDLRHCQIRRIVHEQGIEIQYKPDSIPFLLLILLFFLFFFFLNERPNHNNNFFFFFFFKTESLE